MRTWGAFVKLRIRMGLAVVYTALCFGANAGLVTPALAEGAAPDIAALRSGDMKKLVLLDTPKPLPAASLLDADDAPRSLDEYRGRWLVLNFWATWCAPCRHEMPSLDRLQAAMPDLAVIPLATGRNPVESIQRFYDTAGVKNLPVLRDPTSAFGRQMSVMALPVTVIVDPEGREVARLIGDAEWDSPEALTLLKALTDG